MTLEEAIKKSKLNELVSSKFPASVKVGLANRDMRLWEPKWRRMVEVLLTVVDHDQYPIHGQRAIEYICKKSCIGCKALIKLSRIVEEK